MSKYGFTAKADSITDLLKAEEKKLAGTMTKVARGVRDDLKAELRAQVTRAGLSSKLAQTWQGKVYPASAESLAPAAYVYSKAPNIIDAFARGATIVARNGRRYLAIPNANTPRARQGRAKTPAQVEAQFGRKLRFIPAKSAHGSRLYGSAIGYLALDHLVARTQPRRFRNATAKELSGANRKSAQRVDSVVMFTLEAKVKMPHLFDLQATADEFRASVPERVAEEWN